VSSEIWERNIYKHNRKQIIPLISPSVESIKFRKGSANVKIKHTDVGVFTSDKKHTECINIKGTYGENLS
jgi:hypothetical protein